MGAYYFYINDTKQCYFSIDPFLNNEIKRSFVCNGTGSRGLGYLLWSDKLEHCGTNPHPLVGSWIGDRIYVGSDDYSELFDVSTTNYANISDRIAEMLIVIEPFWVLEYAGFDWLINWIHDQNKHSTLANDMRKLLLIEIVTQYESNPDDELKSLIDAINAG